MTNQLGYQVYKISRKQYQRKAEWSTHKWYINCDIFRCAGVPSHLDSDIWSRQGKVVRDGDASIDQLMIIAFGEISLLTWWLQNLEIRQVDPEPYLLYSGVRVSIGAKFLRFCNRVCDLLIIYSCNLPTIDNIAFIHWCCYLLVRSRATLDLVLQRTVPCNSWFYNYLSLNIALNECPSHIIHIGACC